MTHKNTLAALWLALLCLGLMGGTNAQAVYSAGPTSASAGLQDNPNLLLNLPIVAGRGAGVYSGVSGGTQTGETYRYRHTVARSSAAVSLVYGNFAMNSNGDVSPANAITVKAVLETVSAGASTFYPATFNGLSTVTLQPGQTVRTDPLPVGLTQGQVIFTRTLVTVASSGQVWPVRLMAGGGNSLVPPIQEEGYVTGTTDNTQTAATAFTLSGAPGGYGPLAIIGTPSDGKALGTVCVLGDSISINGTDDGWFSDGSLSPDETFVTRAGNGRFGYLQVGLGGETSGAWLSPSLAIRRAIAQGCTHFVIEYGVNDWAFGVDASALEASRLAIVADLESRGVAPSHIFQTTVTPQSGSTDNWATTANQSFGTGKGPGPSERTNFNDWVRTNPGGVRCLDVASSVEVNSAGVMTTNGGYWHTNPGGSTASAITWTYDGTHPGAAGHTAMSQVLIAAYNAGWFNN